MEDIAWPFARSVGKCVVCVFLTVEKCTGLFTFLALRQNMRIRGKTGEFYNIESQSLILWHGHFVSNQAKKGPCLLPMSGGMSLVLSYALFL